MIVKKILTGAVAALTLGGLVAATATPAAAYPHGGYGYHGGYGRGYGAGAVVGAGLLGLADGAAVSHPYGYGPAYGYGYGYGPGYYGGCRTFWRYDGYGRRFPVQRCY